MTAVISGEPPTYRWTRDEYYRLADIGFFQDRRVELIDGEIIEMAPQKDVHAAVIGLVQAELIRVFGPGCWVRAQLPLFLGKQSEPEPDVSVVPGSPRDYIGTDHPTSALLIVEVSDSTLRYDRQRKASLYAASGVADYWVINLPEHQVEVYRSPSPDAQARFGHSYAAPVILRAAQTIEPLAKPGASIAVSDLLP